MKKQERDFKIEYSLDLKDTLSKIRFTTLQKYLSTRGWRKITTDWEDIAIFRENESEIIVPLTRDFRDYDDVIFKAIKTISKIENRPLVQIINDLTK